MAEELVLILGGQSARTLARASRRFDASDPETARRADARGGGTFRTGPCGKIPCDWPPRDLTPPRLSVHIRRVALRRAASCHGSPGSRPKLELDREAAFRRVDDGQTARSSDRLTGEAQETLETLISGCTFIIRAEDAEAVLESGAALDDDAAADDVADWDDDEELEAELEALDNDIESLGEALDSDDATRSPLWGLIAVANRALARALISRALGRESTVTPNAEHLPGSDEADAERRALDDIARKLLPTDLPSPRRSARADRRAAFDEAAYLIQEIGLEEFDLSCDLVTSRDDVTELWTYPVSPTSAHVALTEFLYDRAEAVAMDDDTLATERGACAWEFSRWSVAPPPGRIPPEMADFPRDVREQEYSLVDHPSVALGSPILVDVATRGDFAELYPRQHTMAVALERSFVDVFVCESVSGSDVRLRSIRSDLTFEVRDHMEPVVYRPGWIAMGRLLPFDVDGSAHLRSPGMMFFPPAEPGLAEAAAESFEKLSETLPPALALEEQSRASCSA